MQIVNPATDEILRQITEDDAVEIRGKLERARTAARHWSRTKPGERLTVLDRVLELLKARREPLARTLTLEVGKPITQSFNEIDALTGRILFFRERIAAELDDEVVLTDLAAGIEERIVHEPLGVVANVSAWNYPYFVGSNVFVPALMTGNAVLYKPSEYATLTGLEIARLLGDADVPDGVFVPVIGGAGTGATLVEQPVDGVFFTGSYATGRKIAESVAPRMIKFQLELGGKDPIYVTDDADVASVAPAVADGAFYNTGQGCCSVERIYVHERVFEAFVERFVETVRGFVVGDPLDPKTYIGPLARREAAFEVFQSQLDDAVGKGARVLTGGQRLAGRGTFVQPTVLADVDHSMRVMTEETFGPLVGLMPVRSDDEALALMRDTPYGLTAGVYTPDRSRAERLLADLDVGSAYWNCCDRVSPRLPWSGRGHSGIGCTLSTYGIETFLKPKAWHLRNA